MKNIKLKISNSEYLRVTYEKVGNDDCAVCTHCDIDYINEEANISIRFGYEFTTTLCYFIAESGQIQQIIRGEMIKNHNIDLGFQWNEYYEGNIKIKDALEHSFISNSHKQIQPYYDSWLYNNEDGDVIFEITPFYPWFNPATKSNPDRISYKKWIKSYKSVLKTIIPKENLVTWIDQAKNLKKMLIDEPALSS